MLAGGSFSWVSGQRNRLRRKLGVEAAARRTGTRKASSPARNRCWDFHNGEDSPILSPFLSFRVILGILGRTETLKPSLSTWETLVTFLVLVFRHTAGCNT